MSKRNEKEIQRETFYLVPVFKTDLVVKFKDLYSYP